jgi:hypothetical protein
VPPGCFSQESRKTVLSFKKLQTGMKTLDRAKNVRLKAWNCRWHGRMCSDWVRSTSR